MPAGGTGLCALQGQRAGGGVLFRPPSAWTVPLVGTQTSRVTLGPGFSGPKIKVPGSGGPVHSSLPDPDSQEGAVEPQRPARNRATSAGGGTNRVPAPGRSYPVLRPALNPGAPWKESFRAEVRKPREPGGGSGGVTACPCACVVLVFCCRCSGAIFSSLLSFAPRKGERVPLRVVALPAPLLLS